DGEGPSGPYAEGHPAVENRLMGAPKRTLRVRGRTLTLGPEPLVMGIVNASPESFSDGALVGSVDDQLERARALVADGAQIIDVGGESGIAGVEPLDPEVEIERVAPLVERVAAEPGVIVSVDTYKPRVARVAVEAGAAMINDVSGLRDPALAEVCADTGAALV